MTKNKSENADFHVSLKLVLRNKKGEILGLKMPDNSSMAGYYDFPGGRIKETEIKGHFKKLIEREIREEVGNKARYKLRETPIAIGRHNYFSKVYRKEQYVFCIFFEADYLGGELKISPEHKEYSWLKLNRRNLKKYFKRGPLEGMTHYFLKKLP
jgi:8-oxo-dGTP pyrophosphatase MutT (NUDIX family)